MIKKSKVTNVQGGGTWSPKDKPEVVYFKFEVEMENGDVGEYSSVKREQDKFSIGQETEYEFIGGKFPKIKPVYQNNFNSGARGSFTENPEKQRIITRLACLGRAIDYFGDNQPKNEILFKQAETFINWATEKPTEKLNTNSTAKAMHDLAENPYPKNIQENEDDLPF